MIGFEYKKIAQISVNNIFIGPVSGQWFNHWHFCEHFNACHVNLTQCYGTDSTIYDKEIGQPTNFLSQNVAEYRAKQLSVDFQSEILHFTEKCKKYAYHL